MTLKPIQAARYLLKDHHDRQLITVATITMKAVGARTLFLLVGVLTGKVHSVGESILVNEDDPAKAELCDYSGISVSQPAQGQYDQPLRRARFMEDPSRGSVRCGPQPTLLRITHPFPNAEFFSPAFVTLHRCGGNCGFIVHPDILQCVAKKTELVTKQVLDTYKSKSCGIQFRNHTECECGCVTKATDCDKEESFDKHTCRCVRN